MAGAKHTPGPWVVSVQKRNRICGPDGVIVAESWRPPARAKRGYNFAAWETAHANAVLIASAPAMFEALCLIIGEEKAAAFLSTGVPSAAPIDAKLKETV
jgi:hypothetical protein